MSRAHSGRRHRWVSAPSHLGYQPASRPCAPRDISCVNLLLLIIILLLLFGGGGFYFGGPAIGGGGLGLVLLIVLIIYLMGGFRKGP